MNQHDVSMAFVGNQGVEMMMNYDDVDAATAAADDDDDANNSLFIGF
jgi:hypothetical protein